VDESILPASLKDKVIEIGSAVSLQDVATYGQLQEIQDKSFRMRTVVNAWERQQTSERELRSRYAKWLLISLSVQMMFVNVAFFMIGLGYLSVEKWVATTFILTVFGEVAAMTLIVVKYLFPEGASAVLALIERL
jgi:hypothetical protein